MPKKTRTRFSRIRTIWQRSRARWSKLQVRVTLAVLALLVLALGVAAFWKQPEGETASTEITPIAVETLKIGSGWAQLELTGTVQDHSSQTLVAQAPGSVQSIRVKEGQYVAKGAVLVQLTSAYGAESAANIGYSSAQKQADLSAITLRSTEQSVSTSRALAQANRDNTEELRAISASTIEGAKAVVGNTRVLIQQLQLMVDANPNDIASRQQLAGAQGSLLQAETALRNLEYSTNKEQEPTKLADLSLQQIQESTELQLQAARLQKDLADLGVRSAAVGVAASQVRAPFAGRIDRIYVDVGEQLNPGAQAVKLVGTTDMQLVFTTNHSIAARLSVGDLVTVRSNAGEEIVVPLSTVTSTPTAGSLHELVINVPSALAKNWQEGGSVTARFGLKKAAAENTVMLPLEAVVVNQTERSILVMHEGKAERRTVETAGITGGYISIRQGLSAGDVVILDRSIAPGTIVSEK